MRVALVTVFAVGVLIRATEAGSEKKGASPPSIRPDRLFPLFGRVLLPQSIHRQIAQSAETKTNRLQTLNSSEPENVTEVAAGTTNATSLGVAGSERTDKPGLLWAYGPRPYQYQGPDGVHPRSKLEEELMWINFYRARSPQSASMPLQTGSAGTGGYYFPGRPAQGQSGQQSQVQWSFGYSASQSSGQPPPASGQQSQGNGAATMAGYQGRGSTQQQGNTYQQGSLQTGTASQGGQSQSQSVSQYGAGSWPQQGQSVPGSTAVSQNGQAQYGPAGQTMQSSGQIVAPNQGQGQGQGYVTPSAYGASGKGQQSGAYLGQVQSPGSAISQAGGGLAPVQTQYGGNANAQNQGSLSPYGPRPVPSPTSSQGQTGIPYGQAEGQSGPGLQMPQGYPASQPSGNVQGGSLETQLQPNVGSQNGSSEYSDERPESTEAFSDQQGMSQSYGASQANFPAPAPQPYQGPSQPIVSAPNMEYQSGYQGPAMVPSPPPPNPPRPLPQYIPTPVPYQPPAVPAGQNSYPSAGQAGASGSYAAAASQPPSKQQGSGVYLVCCPQGQGVNQVAQSRRPTK